uniref:Protein kinase domain-containing protein n=1 Tax=Ditylenchus dipsaci TaxID=166011 RepID=A0A915CTQ0_9BILA
MSSDLASSTSYIMKPAINSEEYDRLARKYAEQSVQSYNIIGTCEQICDEQDLIVEELLLVQGSAIFPMNFSMRIIELRSMDSLYATIREAEMLKLLGFHKNLMGLFSLFRHRQYVAFVLPDFTCLRDRLDSCFRFKKGYPCGRDANRRIELPKQKKRDKNGEPGLFDRNSVAYILKEVIQGASYVHSKGYIHTQICTANIYMSNSSDVKLGGFCTAKGLVREIGKGSVHPSFDVWSVGLLALEVITGQRWHYPSGQIQKVAEDLVSGKLLPPVSLGEVDPSILRDGKQFYHEEVDSFLGKINAVEAKADWQAHPPKHVEVERGRSLHAEMVSAHCEASELDVDFLMNIVKAVRLAEKQCFPIVKKVPDSQLLTEFVAIAAVLMIRRTDDDWSRDVLDQSRTSSNDYLKDYQAKEGLSINRRSRTPMRSRGISLPGDNFRRTMTPKNTELEKLQQTRQVFVALQFARWYLANLLRFSDLLRIVDEIEDILKEYASSETLLDTVPGSASFITGLRKSHLDQDSRKFNNVHIEIALRSRVISEMKKNSISCKKVILWNSDMARQRSKRPLLIES